MKPEQQKFSHKQLFEMDRWPRKLTNTVFKVDWTIFYFYTM